MSLRSDLERWVRAGLLNDDQAAAIESFESQRHESPVRAPARQRRIPPVAEALGYLGGTLGLVGLVLLIARSWGDLPPAGRLGITAAGTAAFVVAGFFVREDSDPALARLRWFLWLVATGAAGVFGATVERQIADVDADARTAMIAAVAVTVLSFALRGTGRRPVQHFTMLGGAVVTVGTALGHLVGQSAGGLGVWIVGLALVAAGLGRHDHDPLIATLVGAAAAVVGPLLLLDERPAVALIVGLLTSLTLVAAATLRSARADGGQRVALAIIGSIALVQGVPSTIAYFATGAGVTTGMVVWATGWLLVLAAPRPAVRAPLAVMVVGGIATLVGPAVAASESVSVGTTLGLVTSVALLVVGAQPGRVLMSAIGSIGLLVYVPWSISHFFPGEGRAPLLILVSGIVIVVVAVMLTRLGGRFRRELGRNDGSSSNFSVDRATDQPVEPSD